MLAFFVPIVTISTIHITTAFISTTSFHGAKFSSLAKRSRVKQWSPRGSKENSEDDSEFQLRVLRQKLEAMGITVPPTATRGELEELAVLARKDRPTRRSQRPIGAISYEDEFSDTIYPARFEAQSPRRRQLTARNRSTRRRLREGTSAEKEKGPVNRSDSRQSRRERRYQRQGIPRSTSNRLRSIPNRFVSMGSRATKMATHKTKQIWDNLVDLTYEDDISPQRERRSPTQRKQSQKISSTERAPSPDSLYDDLQPTEREGKRGYSEPDIGQDFKEGSLEKSTSSNVNMMDDGVTWRSGTSEEDEEFMPIGELLHELDSRQIEYSPASTRRELECLLAKAKQRERLDARAAQLDSFVLNEKIENTNKEGTIKSTSKHDAQTSGLDYEDSPADLSNLDSDSPSWGRVLKKSARMASKKARAMPQRARATGKHVARTIGDKAQTTSSRLFSEKSIEKKEVVPEVMDAIIEDFSRDEVSKFDYDRVVEVEAVKDESLNGRRKDMRAYRNPTNPVEKPQRPSKGKDRRRRPRPKTRARKVADTGEYLRSDYHSVHPINRSAYRLPPADDVRGRTESRKRGERTPTDTARKVYSPYDSVDPFFDRDGLDEWGDRVARSVDDFLWGNATSDESRERSTTSPRAEGQNRGYWKDRMEEQFDAFMGIHEDGKHYKRWMNQELQAEEDEDGSDALSYARGRGHRKRKKRKSSGKPIWEERDSLIGLVFGTNDPRSYRGNFLNRSPSILGSTSVLKLMQSLLQSGALVASGVSRWASVRGSLPQPIVVAGLISTILTSRPRARVRNLILALLALRSIGELLDGYMYEDDDLWNSENDDEDEMDTTAPGMDNE